MTPDRASSLARKLISLVLETADPPDAFSEAEAWDSLAQIELLFAIQEAVGIPPEPSEIEKLTDRQSLAVLLRRISLE